MSTLMGRLKVMRGGGASQLNGGLTYRYLLFIILPQFAG